MGSGYAWRDLPGERVEDLALLHGLASSMQRLSVETQREANFAIGQLILDRLFPSPEPSVTSEDLWDHRRRRHRSFQALRQREPGRPSWSHLNECVRVLLQHDWLPADAADALSFSHLKVLVRLPHGPDKRELAVRAVAEGLSERRLRELVHTLRPGLHRRELRTLRISRMDRLTAALELALREVAAQEGSWSANTLTPSQRDRALALAQELRLRLERIVEQLSPSVEG